MDQTSEHINSSNNKINFHDQMRKIIVNLVSKKYENNNTSTCQLTRLHNFLFMSIVDICDKYEYYGDIKSNMIKLRTSKVNSSST